MNYSTQFDYLIPIIDKLVTQKKLSYTSTLMLKNNEHIITRLFAGQYKSVTLENMIDLFDVFDKTIQISIVDKEVPKLPN